MRILALSIELIAAGSGRPLEKRNLSLGRGPYLAVVSDQTKGKLEEPSEVG